MNTTSAYHEVLLCDPVAGTLTWKEREGRFYKNPLRANAWNARFSGKPAGAVIHNPRNQVVMRVAVFGRRTLVHRVIWEMCVGPIPADKVIDHISGDTLDNRLCNLRIADKYQNGSNSKLNRLNTSGYRGVQKVPYGRFTATITVRRKVLYLGSFGTAEEASAAYVEAAKKHHGEFSRPSSFSAITTSAL